MFRFGLVANRPDARWNDFPEARRPRDQNEPQRFELLVNSN